MYGQCADYDALQAVCSEYDVAIIEDAAEALGATYKGRPAGTFGRAAAFSFNGNKIITTSGGGMLVSNDSRLCERARFLASQAREKAAHYEHRVVGYNYRMSNLLAALGRGQLMTLDQRVRARRAINQHYRDRLGDIPGLEFMPVASYGEPNFWLTCILIDPPVFGLTSDELREQLSVQAIETRPTWKPMHMQPLYRDSLTRGGAVAADVFERGLCLPSGSSLSATDLERVISAIRQAARLEAAAVVSTR